MQKRLKEPGVIGTCQIQLVYGGGDVLPDWQSSLLGRTLDRGRTIDDGILDCKKI